MRVFHAENIFLGKNVYVGHDTHLKAYYKNQMRIGDNTWIGQQCFFHAAGGIDIGQNVGIGPAVKILTSVHAETAPPAAITSGQIEFAPVVIKDGCDLGVGCIIMPGVTLGQGVQVGAGSVVTKDVPDGMIVAGVPARILRQRGQDVNHEHYQTETDSKSSQGIKYHDIDR